MKNPPLLLLAVLCCANLAQARPQAREVWISPDTYGDPRALLVAVKEVVDANPDTQRFRFAWGLASPHAGNEGLLIYDKARQVLWIRQTNFSNVSDDEEAEHPIYNVGNFSQQWRFSGVTPNRLRLLFRRYGLMKYSPNFSDTAYEVSFFPRLSQFGCRGGLVGRTSENFRQKLVKDRFVRVRRK